MSYPLKIMQVTYSLDYGGAEKVAIDLAAGVDKHEYQTCICALDYGGKYIPLLDELGIPWYFFNRNGALDYKLWISLYHLFKRERIAVIQTHHVVQLFNAIIPALLNGIKIIHTEHEYQSFLNNPKDLQILKILCRMCHSFVTVGHDVTEFMENEKVLPKGKIITIPNGVSLGTCTYESKCYARKEFGFTENHLIIGITARLEWRKDHKTLLQAFAHVVKQNHNARLLIIGDGCLKYELKMHAKKLGIEYAVIFAGARGDVNTLLAILDVFVLSSVHEGLPVALLEAMAAEKPVVCTAVGEMPKVIVQGFTGLLIPPRDPKELSSALLFMLENEKERIRLGKNAKEYVRKYLSMEKMLDSYETLYRSVLTGAGTKYYKIGNSSLDGRQGS